MANGEATVLQTSDALCRRKIAAWGDELPSLRLVLTGCKSEPTPGYVPLEPTMTAADSAFETAPNGPMTWRSSISSPAPPASPRARFVSMRPSWSFTRPDAMLDPRAGGIFWRAANPGWVTAISYGIVSSFVNGMTPIVDETDFGAERWYRILAEDAHSPVQGADCDADAAEGRRRPRPRA